MKIINKIQWLFGVLVLLVAAHAQAATVMSGSASFSETSGLFSGTLFAEVSGTAGNYTSAFSIVMDADSDGSSSNVRDITFSSFMLGSPINFFTGATSGGSTTGDPSFSLNGTSALFTFGLSGLAEGSTSNSFWFNHADLDLLGDSMFFGLSDYNNNVASSFSLNLTPVPLPAAAWLFGSGLVGLAGMLRRKKK